MSQTKRKILSLIVSAAMVLQTTAPTVFALEGETQQPKTIIGISALEQTEYSLPVGASEETVSETLTFPTTITANVQYTVTEEVIPPPIVDSGEPEGEATPSSADETTAQDETPPQDETPAQDETTVKKTIIEQAELSVTWESDKELNTADVGEFTYTAVLANSDSYTLADGVTLPQITVQVTANVAPEKTALEKCAELFAALPKADSITEKTTDEEKAAINTQLGAAMAAYEALNDTDKALFDEQHSELLKAAMALNDALIGNVPMLMNSPAVRSFDISKGNITVAGGTTSGTIKVTYNDGTAEKTEDNIAPADMLTFTGTTTANKVIVNAGTSTNPVNITLNGVDIQFNDGGYPYPGTCAFDIQNSSVVNLTLAGDTTNTLKSGVFSAGLQVPSDATAAIGGAGTLNATGVNRGAGIGGGSGSSGGTITISDSANVTAIGGKYAAGIGGGYRNGGGKITISESANVTATGGDDGAGIGGGEEGAGGTISIGDSANVTATGRDGGAGIGGGWKGAGGTITISGGTVTATGGKNATGIGGGYNGAAGTFSTGTNGNAFIMASSIAHQDNKSEWSGIIFEGNNGKIYGTPTLKTNAEIPTGKTLVIEAEQTLTIGAGVTLTNNGTITNNGTLTNNGAIDNNGTLSGNPPSGDGTINKSSQVAVTFSKNSSNITEAAYGDTITITATASEKTNSRSRAVSANTVDFYIGEVNENNKLGTANVNSSEDTYVATLEVTLNETKWIPNAETAYTITADFGGVAGLLASTGTGTLTVQKANQQAPTAPTAETIEQTAIKLNAVNGSGQGALQYGYKVGDEEQPSRWQSDVTFINLKPGTAYTFYTRFVGDEYYNEEVSDGTTITTLAATTSLPTAGLSIADGTISIKGDGENLIIQNGNVVYSVSKNTNVKIIGETTVNKIVVNAGTEANPVNITLNGVSIDVSGTYQACAFDIQGNSVVNLTLAGDTTNTLKSGENRAGLQVQTKDGQTAAVTIDGTGTLNATGGERAAGIGGGYAAGGTITISGSANVTATGGRYGAGIGGCTYSEGGTITISDSANVTATGVGGGAGIGGGYGGAGGTIAISGGTVTATGEFGGADIGVGYGSSSGSVSITGGSVKAGSISPVPTNGSVSVYATTITATAGQKIESLSLSNGSETISYGKPAVVPSSGDITLYLPVGSYTGAAVIGGKLITLRFEIKADAPTTGTPTDTNITITTPEGTEVSTNPDGTVTLPNGSTVKTDDGPVITLPNGGTSDKDGNVSGGANNPIKVGDTTITPPAGGTVTTDKDGKTELPSGSTVSKGDTTVTIGGETSGATVDKDGNVKLPSGGEITVTDKENNTSTIEVPSTGGDVGVKNDGTVTVPGGSTVTPPSGGTPITVPEGGGTVSGGGQVDNNITVSTVTVAPTTANVEKGKTQQFSATVTGTNNPAQTVTWTLEGYTGTASSISASGLLTVGSGETASTITVRATSTFDTTKSGTAIVTVKTSSSSGGGSTGGGSSSSDNDDDTTITVNPPTKPTTENPKPATEVTTTVKPTISNGVVNVTVGKDTIDSAIKKAQDEAKKNGTTENGIIVEFKVDTKNVAAKDIKTSFSKASIDALVKAGTKEVRITSDVVSLILDLNTLKEIQKQIGSDVDVVAKKVDNKTLSAAEKAIVGNRPVYDLSITGANGKKITNFGKGKVSVSIPYTLGANENAANVVAYYIDSTGKVTEMANSVYDPVTKTLSFVTDHFSKFAVGYKTENVKFTDITNHWAKDSIEFVAARGLLAGTGNNKFSPNTSMTRGMFVTALYRLAGSPSLEDKILGYPFADVDATAYYGDAVYWARLNNIVQGVTAETFAPEQKITREQMAVIMVNYAKAIGFELPKVHGEITFADNAKISSYASTAVKQMQMAGILSGKSNNKFDPQGTATRAEVSAVLKRFVELVINTDNAEGWTVNDSGKWLYYKDGKALTGKQNIDGVTYDFNSYGETSTAPSFTFETYIVKKGESWWSIAWDKKVNMFTLAKVNGKTIFSMLYVGDELKIPSTK